MFDCGFLICDFHDAFRGTYDHPDASAHRPVHDAEDLAHRFKLNISDDGDGKPKILSSNNFVKRSSLNLFLFHCFVLISGVC